MASCDTRLVDWCLKFFMCILQCIKVVSVSVTVLFALFNYCDVVAGHIQSLYDNVML